MATPARRFTRRTTLAGTAAMLGPALAPLRPNHFLPSDSRLSSGVSPTAGRSGHPWGRIANGSRRGQQILTGLFFAGPPNPNSLSLYSTAAVRRRRHDRGAMGGSGRTARVDVDDRPAPHRSGDGSRAVIEWTHFKTSAGTVLRGDEWYVFDSRSGLIREIGAYYASPQSADLDRLELGGFDYAARGYACEPPFVRADNAPEAP